MTARSFDIVVIGAGPAGLAAARAAAGAGLSVVAVDRMGPGGELMNLGALVGTEAILPDAQGPDLVAHLAEEAMAAGVELAIDEAQSVALGEQWRVEALDEQFTGAAVVVATGLTPGTTGLAEEARYEGRGLSHCAHCDAPLYAGKPVVVAGDDAWAVEEAIHLAGEASAVTLVASAGAPSGGRLAELLASPNASRLEGRVAGLGGADGLESVTVETAAGPRTVEARGLFLQAGRVPARAFLPPDAETAEGIYWAGDVRRGAGRTVAEAIADGVRAGQNAAAWVKARKSA